MRLLIGLMIPAIYFATPLVVAALGELVVERAGVVNIGIEGMMLAGALAAWAVDAQFGAAWALLASAAASGALALIFAVACLVFTADQIVTGTGINLLAYGATAMIYRSLPAALADHVRGIDKRLLIALTPFIAGAIWCFFAFTRSGLELAAIGEAPHAADTAGIPVRRRQAMAILFGAACAGVGGAYLSIMYDRVFTENMTGGIGFLALAMVIFGRWSAPGIVLAGLFFGLVQAIGDNLETRPGFSLAALQSFHMLPYVVSLIALASVARRSPAPAALGRPFIRG